MDHGTCHADGAQCRRIEKKARRCPSPHSASEGLFRYPGTAEDPFGASAARATFSPERGPKARGMVFSAPGPKAHGMLSEGVWHVVPGPQACGVVSLARGSTACNAVCSPHARGQKERYVFLQRMARRRVMDSPMRVAESAWQKAHGMLSLARDSKACDTVEVPWCAARKRVVGSPRRVAQRCVICNMFTSVRVPKASGVVSAATWSEGMLYVSPGSWSWPEGARNVFSP